MSQILGQYSKSVNQFVSPGVFGYSLNIKDNWYNPEEANDRIKEIFGQEGRKTSLDLTADYTKIGEYIQNEFKQINIKVELNYMSPQDLIEKIQKKETSMYLLGWQSESGDSGDLLNSLFLKDAQLNSAFIGTGSIITEVNQAILETNQELNQKKRLQKLQKIMEILVDQEVVGIPLFEGERIFAVNSGIDFNPRTDGMVVLKEIKPNN